MADSPSPSPHPHRRRVQPPAHGVVKQWQAEQREGDMIAAAREREYGQRLSTAALRRLPSNQDAIEIQAFLLRREGYSYRDIARLLEVSRELAVTLVEMGGKACVDEDPETALRLHLSRLEGLVQAWYPGALKADAPTLEERAEARDTTKLVLQILALQDRVGVWLAQLPRRGQERKEEDDHAEIKAILLRAEEYGAPPGQGGMPHGLPLLNWKPADVEDAPHQDPRPGDAPQAPGGSGAETLPHTRPSTLW